MKKKSQDEEKEELLERGSKLLKENKYKEAEKLYLEVLKIDQKNVPSYKGLAHICFAQKDYKDAHEILEKLTKLVPDDASNYCNLGMCCYKEKDFTRALKHYEKAVTIERKPSYFRNLGIVQIQLKEYDQAALSFLEFLTSGKSKDSDETLKLLINILPEIKDKKIIRLVVGKLIILDPENKLIQREARRLGLKF